MKHQPMRRPDHNTGNYVCPTLFDKCVGSLTSPAVNHVRSCNTEDAGNGAYGLLSLPEKTSTELGSRLTNY